jgi:hypothetical protein
MNQNQMIENNINNKKYYFNKLFKMKYKKEKKNKKK